MAALVALALLMTAAARPANRSLALSSNRRQLGNCERHDESDSNIAQCQSWCMYPEHCAHCKCRSCSMCRSCQSDQEGDIGYEA